MGPSDEEAMRAVRDGDLGMLALLFERHHAGLFHFFCRMTANRAVADDLVQEVFFRILKYRGTFRPESRFVAWMFHIARNVRIDHGRRSADRPVTDDEAEHPSPAPLPGEQLQRDQETELLKQALLQLPEDKRELLVLARYQELQYREIAEILEVDVGVVKVRVHRAIKELREIFMHLSERRTPCNVKSSATSFRTI